MKNLRKWLRSSCQMARRAATQQTFPWYDPSEYKPMPDPHWPDPHQNPIGVLQEILDESPQGASEFINGYEDVYNPEMISFQNTCVTPPADPILVIQVGKSRYVVDVELEQVKPLQEWFADLYDHELAHYAPCPDQNEEFWSSVPAGPGTYLYHATDPANLDSIKRKGLSAASETRTMSNRNMGAAVFTSWNEHAISSYGELVIAIDVGMMKADKYMPQVSKEEPFEDVEMRSSLAHKLGLEYEGYSEYESSEGLSQETVAIYGNIPPRYLSFPD